MGDFKINEKSVFTQSGSDEPVLASNVTGGSGLTLAGTVGMIAPFAMASAPTGWIICDGSAVSRTVTYDALFDVIGTTWGSGNGSSTFNLPDLRGAFLRGTGSHGTSNMADGNDFAGQALGAFENDQMQGHWHQPAVDNSGIGSGLVGFAKGTNFDDNTTSNSTNQNIKSPITDGTNGTPRVGDETRPFNAGVNYCIKY
tara:strand:+ start:784 stop:1380 length:597 start_codon:yes stop_codon:yes gene_type:complete